MIKSLNYQRVIIILCAVELVSSVEVYMNIIDIIKTFMHYAYIKITCNNVMLSKYKLHTGIYIMVQ